MDAGRRLRRVAAAAAAVVAALAVAPFVRADRPPRDLALESLDGSPVRPFAAPTNGWVFVFTRTDCPVAARYTPELQRLAGRASAAHVAFHLVFVDPSEAPSAERSYLREYGYSDFALRDPAHRLVRLTGATATPEAAIFLPSKDGPRLIYRGRIDDRYVDIGRMRPAPTRHDVDDVLTAIVKGQALEFRSTPAVGCLIADVTR